METHATHFDVWMIGHFHQGYIFTKKIGSYETDMHASKTARFVMLGEWIRLHTFAKWDTSSPSSSIQLYQYDPLNQSSTVLEETPL